MKKEDYFKYYVQGSDHYLIPKDAFEELFNEMENWKENAKKYKEVMAQLSAILQDIQFQYGDFRDLDIVIDLLKEVE